MPELIQGLLGGLWSHLLQARSRQKPANRHLCLCTWYLHEFLIVVMGSHLPRSFALHRGMHMLCSMHVHRSSAYYAWAHMGIANCNFLHLGAFWGVGNVGKGSLLQDCINVKIIMKGWYFAKSSACATVKSAQVCRVAPLCSLQYVCHQSGAVLHSTKFLHSSALQWYQDYDMIEL